jgi:hypothetical protein
LRRPVKTLRPCQNFLALLREPEPALRLVRG